MKKGTTCSLLIRVTLTWVHISSRIQVGNTYMKDIEIWKEDYYIYDKELNNYVKYNTNLFDSYNEEIAKYKQVLLYLGIGSIVVIFVLILIILHKPKRKKVNKKVIENKDSDIEVKKIEKESIKEEKEIKPSVKKEDITKEIDEATKIIDDFESNNKKEEKKEAELEPTMYDIFSEDKKKKKRKKK